MRMIFAGITGLLVGASALAFQGAAEKPKMHGAIESTYEHLATAIIEIRATENSLVEGILTHYHAQAQRHLAQASRPKAQNRVSHLEAAATEITNMANEGNKRVQAVRQRLLKAGHHHHSDADTKDDYLFVDSNEKKKLLDLARKVGRMGDGASADEVKKTAAELRAAFRKCMAAE